MAGSHRYPCRQARQRDGRTEKRSLPATPDGLEMAKQKAKRFTSQQVIADDAGVSRSTVSKFLNGRSIGVDNVQAICEVLKLDWKVVTGLTESDRPEQTENESSTPDEINAIVQRVRNAIESYIRACCGTMRVLDMAYPIELGKIYTQVNVLEEISARQWQELTYINQEVERENFDRFCLGQIKQKRVPALEAVGGSLKVNGFGKPGSGKTTLLKHLAIECIGGNFQANRVPIFVTLKDFAEAEDKPNLLDYTNMLSEGGLQTIVKQGRALFLFDGLDEVLESDSNRVLSQIKELSYNFADNQFVMTCRNAAKKYPIEPFTEVEVADFTNEEIREFSKNVFTSRNEPETADLFINKLNSQQSVRELASNPLLLSLLCLVFEDAKDFPQNRARLYEMGIEKLLRTWNPRPREQDVVYKEISPDRRQELLSYMAWETFQNGNYFFRTDKAQKLVNAFFQQLPGISQEDRFVNLNSKAVLDSIEVQHGLLVERARGIYSFANLPFHEYFTAKYIADLAEKDDAIVSYLADCITESVGERFFYCRRNVA